VDGSSASAEALRWAIGQARLTGRSVDAVSSWEIPVNYGVGPLVDLDWEGAATTALKETVATAVDAADAGRVVPRVVRGHPAQVLLEAAAEADLLVVGSRGRGGFTGMLLGSVSQHVVARAACPVVIVRSPAAPQASARIVVGVDGSTYSEEALRWAIGQARLTGQPVEAVISWTVPADFSTGAAGALMTFDWEDVAASTLKETVATAVDPADADRVSQRVVMGHPARVLLDAAADAALLVVGSRGRGGFTGMLLGSVSQHVIARADCPVVVLRDPATPPE
jgi:nucleotide-binding universal stress UspA family protein